jgi:Uma2 family endonuclease
MTAYPQPMRLRFTVDEFYKMFELGFIKDYEHAEIIDGELIKKMSIGDLHAAIVDFLNEFFVKNVPGKVRIRVQNPVRLSDYHEPEPDLALTDLTKYDGRRHPRPSEILLLVEVSDSTVEYDRNRKLPLYAEAEIPEVWLVNVQNETVEIHTRPRGGIFSLIRVLRSGDTIQSEIVPSLEIEVDKILLKSQT